MIPELSQRRTEIERLCIRLSVRRLELFGSAVIAEELPAESDLDFLVEFGSLPPGTYADTYFALRECLEQLFGRPVDLVVASAIKNPFFRESVARTKALLYAA